MSDKRDRNDLLEGAYAISTPEDSVAYYRDFAASYDRDFADALGYVYPKVIAQVFSRHADQNDRPVADIGCGTGLVAAELGVPAAQIDGFDISPEMLAVSGDKGLYRALHRVDLTAPITLPDRYGALVSAGTFTHGHLGPEPLENILTLARPGALLVIGINARHFEEQGFAPVLGRLQETGRITRPLRETVDLYSKPDTPHGADQAQVLVFRTT